MADRAERPEQFSPASAAAETGPPRVVARLKVRSRRWWRVVAMTVAGLVIAAMVADLVVTNVHVADEHPLTNSAVNAIASQRANAAISELQSAPPVASTVYSAVRPGLVVVETKKKGVAGIADLGSGVIVDQEGAILTALHVVAGASAIQVTFADGTSASAAITTSEANQDIAVLSAERLPAVVVPAVLGAPPQIGDPVFAMGNPLGLAGSLSAGIVSGLDRTFTAQAGRILSGLIQFDAAIDPGSSGGPLLNTKGQVIGIVTGLANPTGADSFSGIGFAVPIATAASAAGAPAK